MARRNFSRGEPGTKRERNKVILIICEGEKTEPLYFGQLKSEVRLPSINIEIIKTKERDPFKLVDSAEKICEHKGFSITDTDMIWFVFDMDNSHMRVKKAVEKINKMNTQGRNNKKDKLYNVALSTPSFELWYLLHYSYTETKMDNKEVKKQLSDDLPNYNKTDRNLPSTLCEKRGEALKNAKKLLKHHETEEHDLYSDEANPITHVFKLVELILDSK